MPLWAVRNGESCATTAGSRAVLAVGSCVFICVCVCGQDGKGWLSVKEVVLGMAVS